jgi:hypothetical protein
MRKFLHIQWLDFFHPSPLRDIEIEAIDKIESSSVLNEMRNLLNSTSKRYVFYIYVYDNENLVCMVIKSAILFAGERARGQEKGSILFHTYNFMLDFIHF